MLRRIPSAICGLFCVFLFARASRAQTLDPVIAQAAQTYPDNARGIQQQFRDILEIVRIGDEASIHRALDTLRIPNVNQWIASHFSPLYAPEEQSIYRRGFETFESHVWWVMGNFGKNPEFFVKAADSQLARPLENTGLEGLVPRPLDEVRVENFRFSCNLSDPKYCPGSWVDSFIYMDGMFRLAGGTYPFWEEKVIWTLAKMPLPREVIHGREVRVFGYLGDAKEPGIDEIVHILIEVGRDGKIKDMEILSGDPHFVSDAKKYLQKWVLLKLETYSYEFKEQDVWDFAVVFFARKH
jgi:hypothetical protein